MSRETLGNEFVHWFYTVEPMPHADDIVGWFLAHPVELVAALEEAGVLEQVPDVMWNTGISDSTARVGDMIRIPVYHVVAR